MKAIAVLLMSCLSLSFCSKRDNSNEEKQKEEKQEALSQEPVGQEIQKLEVSYPLEELEVLTISYVFDIDSFRFLDEFPRTIEGIKEMYPDAPFEEKTYENVGKGYSGKYTYLLDSPNIGFSFYGDTAEEAILKILVILNRKYECKNMQIIGMSVEELIRLCNEKLTPEGGIKISKSSNGTIFIYTDPDLYELRIDPEDAKDGIIKKYFIYRACPKNCVNGHKVVEIPKEKTWSWHEKEKRRKRILSTNCLIISTFAG